MWRRVTTPAGINDELFPWLRMTVPKALAGKTIEAIPVGPRLGRSWLLLLGVLPIDDDDLAIAALEPGPRFLERSRMLAIAAWEHGRRLGADDAGCRVEGRIGFVLRAPHAVCPRPRGAAGGGAARAFRASPWPLHRWCVRTLSAAGAPTSSER